MLKKKDEGLLTFDAWIAQWIGRFLVVFGILLLAVFFMVL